MSLLLIFLIVLLTSFNLDGQNWIGYGEGVAFLKIEDGKAYAITCQNEFNFECKTFNPGLNVVDIVDYDTGEKIFWLWIDLKRVNIDSIKLKAQNGNTMVTLSSRMQCLERKLWQRRIFYGNLRKKMQMIKRLGILLPEQR